MTRRGEGQQDLREALAGKADAAPPKADDTALARQGPAEIVHRYLERMKPEIARALPKHLNADRLARVALTVIRTNPKLLNCTMPSLLAAVMQAAQLGLEPGLLGHCYFVPFQNKKTGQLEVQFIVGYRGMVDLARRSGHILSICAREVYANDHLVVRYGLEERLDHIPWHLREDKQVDQPGALRGFYTVAKFMGGGCYMLFMPKAEVDAHRARSKAANDGPWVTDYVEMGKKTVVRSGWKWLPISVEVMRGVEATDEAVRQEPAQVLGDPDVMDVPFEVQEVPEAPAQPEA